MAAEPFQVCVDVGSTFTKAAAVGLDGRLLATAQAPTTVGTDVLAGLDAAVAALEVGPVRDADLLVCSSAGGGLRLAVIGQERVVSAEAGRRVALSAGARVVGVWAGPLDPSGADAVAEAVPDVVLLVGGTDGGDPEILLHNARAWGRSEVAAPVVVAGNAEVADEATRLVRRRGRRVMRSANPLPRIGVLDPEPAREVIRDVFIRHVIGGKGLSSGPRFARLVRGATPDAVLAGVEVVAAAAGAQGAGDVLVIDVGGATTDVFSAVGSPAERDRNAGDSALVEPVETSELSVDSVVGRALAARTVEGDLGMRWSAPDVVRVAQAERLLEADAAGLGEAAVRRHAEPGFLPATAAEVAIDLELAGLAAVVAVRRHARPGGGGRDLRDTGLVIGSGGALRHATPVQGRAVLDRVLADRAGGWARPVSPRVVIDTDYLLAPIGLLALAGHADAAHHLAIQLL